MSFNVKAPSAFKKLGAVALITADTTVSMSFELNPVEGGAVLILNPDKLDIKVKAKTADGSAIQVEGCNETTLTSDVETTLNATGTRVVLKGNITELNCHWNKLVGLSVQGLTSLQTLNCYKNQLTSLNLHGCVALQKLYCTTNKLKTLNAKDLAALQELFCGQNQLTELNVQGYVALQKLVCSSNQLPELNVQGLTALQELECHSNKINAEEMTKLLNALPTREASDGAKAVLYTEQSGKVEGNCKDFTQSEDLKKALNEAKSRNWKLQKLNASGYKKEI